MKRDALIKAVETALVCAAREVVDAGRDLRCVIDRKTGDIKAFAKMIVADPVTNKRDEISLAAARKVKADAQVANTRRLRSHRHRK
jgi:N utilization substance protein A